MVAALVGLLVSHTGLLKQIDVNEATSQLSHVVEVDPDELTEPGGVRQLTTTFLDYME